MSPIEAFLLGIKPALYEALEDVQEHPELFDFPHVANIRMLQGEPHAVFFRAENEEKHFLAALERIHNRIDLHRLLGQTLGFPPKAIESFIARQQMLQEGVSLEDITRNAVGLRYCGVQCSGDIDNLIKDCAWLWDQYPKGKDTLKVEKDRVLYAIAFQDFDELKQIQQHIRSNIDK